MNSLMFRVACSSGDEMCLRNTSNMFHDWLNNNQKFVYPFLACRCYCTGDLFRFFYLSVCRFFCLVYCD